MYLEWKEVEFKNKSTNKQKQQQQQDYLQKVFVLPFS